MDTRLDVYLSIRELEVIIDSLERAENYFEGSDDIDVLKLADNLKEVIEEAREL